MLSWLGFFTYEEVVILLTDNTHYNFWFIVPVYSLNVLLFYFNSNFVLPRLYAQTHRWVWRYAIAVLLLLAVYGLLRCEINLHLAPALGFPTPGSTYSYGRFWALAVYRGMFFQFASMGYWFTRNAILVGQQKERQQAQLRVTEKSLMEANLAFLKNQINPHFLFNSLNFLYAQVYPHSENAARGILLLSETMRYALHEDNNGKVMLTHEVKHLRNYIAINQLRFNNQLQINFEVLGNVQFLMIIPLVLITFVENCFKHGELADPAHPLTIRLAVVQNRLTFETHNKKRHGPKEKSTGIGLANTRQRLELLYKDRYELITNDEPNHYTCIINIAL
ncbi:sensor histidine kinase [Hymenobacter coccineus]|uniref:sensor histidine kinase n=1 Tax=Hymenobacter coccineus TaxID=1908235 RepID=UPI00130167E8|nr:histidine kinase [Hymenobacter coccineus]